MQKKKNNIKIVSLAGMMLISFFVFALSIQAQENKTAENKIGAEGTTVAVATANIYDAKILSQDGTELKIAFDLYNREMIQSGVKYAVMLFQKNKDTLKLMDEKVYDESLNMYEDYTIHREIDYSAPKFLSGDFEIWVMAQNEKGLPLGQNVAGVATLTGGNNFVEIMADSCFLQVEGEAENKKYDLTQGVDVSSTENLITNCELKNNFSAKQEVVPVFTTFNRSVFGEKVAEEKGNSFSMIGSEKMKVSLTIPKAPKPQAYDAVLTLQNSKGETISNQVVFHYVIQGASATAQNVRLDKDYYAKGETARVSFFGTLSADDFSGSRNGGTKIDEPRVELVITDTEKNMCSAIVSKNLDEVLAGTLDVSITEECRDPQVKIFIKDKNDKVLDFNSAEIVSRNNLPQMEMTQKEDNRIALVIFLAVLFLAVASVLMSLRKNKISSVKKMMLMLLVGMGIFSFAGEAKADTFYPSGSTTNAKFVYSAQLDKREYVVGENIKAMGTAYNGGCNNGAPRVTMSATINNQTIPLINTNVRGGKGVTSPWYLFKGHLVAGKDFKAIFNFKNYHADEKDAPSFSDAYNILYSVKNIDSPICVGCPINANSGEEKDFSFLAVDPLGRKIEYQIDWNNDGTADENGSIVGELKTKKAFVFSAPATQNYQNFNFSARARIAGGNFPWTDWSNFFIRIHPVIPPAPVPSPTPTLAPVIPSSQSGDCGSLDKKTSCQAPSGSQLCTSGTVSTLKLDTSVDPNKWMWSCVGANGGTTENCSALKTCGWKEVNP